MKIVVINQSTAFVRHWFRWYRVLRSGEDWRPLNIGQKYQKPKTVEQIANSLNKKHPSGKLPTILDEKHADKQVQRNTRKAKRKPKH